MPFEVAEPPVAELAGVEDVTIPVPGRITSIAAETHNTFTITIENTEGAHWPGFKAGQFSMLYAFGVGEAPISISGDPADSKRLVYTIRSVGQVSRALVSQMPGDCLGVRGPFGTSWPLEAARGKDVLIVAGGIGLAPLRPAIYHILRHRADYGRLIVLYGARSPRDMLFRKQVWALRDAPDTQLLLTVDYAGMEWTGHVGVVTKLFDFAITRPNQTISMMCGPEIMMRFVLRELIARKFHTDRIYLSMERNMKCAIGLCGHCQMGPYFICKDGPVFAYQQVSAFVEGLNEL